MDLPILKLFMLVVLAKFTYSVEYAIEEAQYYDIMKHQQVTFTCTYNGTIGITEYVQSIYKDIIINSILADDRFTYMNTTVDGKLVHKITLKNATLDLHHASYTCYRGGIFCCASVIRITQEQEEPMCITNYYTKTPDELTRFECVSKSVYPPVNLETIVPSSMETSYSVLFDYDIYHSYTRNDTHVVRKIAISGYMEDIDTFDCEAYQNFPNGELNKKVCYFEPPPTTTILDDTADSNKHNSGRSIYVSAILIFMCLLLLPLY